MLGKKLGMMAAMLLGGLAAGAGSAGCSADSDTAAGGGAASSSSGSGGSGGYVGGGPASCEPGTGALDLHPNIETIGVAVEGGALPATAELRYRPAGEASWQSGHPLVQIDDGRLVGSVFGLSGSTDYEVHVAGAGVDSCQAVTTAPAELLFTPAGVIYVDAAAAGGGDGSAGAPFRTIQEGVNAAGSGSQVLVADGIYHEQVELPASGAPDSWIQVKAAGPGAVIDGSEHLTGAIWAPHGTVAGVWSTDIGQSCWYLGRDGQRYYRYNDLAGLLAGLGDDDVPMDEGFYVEPGGSVLYVRSLDDPAGHSWQVPRLDRAFVVDGVDWVWIEGFEIRFFGQGQYGSGIYLKNASHTVVRGNEIHGVPGGINVNWTEGEDRSNDTRIEDNEIYDPPVESWPWDAVKGTSMEGSAIRVSGRRGAIVRGNDIHHFFNGIYTGRWGDLENPEIAFDADIYDNHIAHIGDDGLEPEGTCINHRFRRNHFEDGLVGISLAPITMGPAWVLRSVFAQSYGTSFKWGIDSDGVILIYHNTSWTDLPEENGMTIGSPVHNSVMRNNIFHGTRYAFEVSFEGCTGHDWNHDNWHTSRTGEEPHFKWENVRYDTMAELCQATGLECDGHELEPGLSDPAGGDFSLAAGSPNVDAALLLPGINDLDQSGAGPDIGCCERPQ